MSDPQNPDAQKDLTRQPERSMPDQPAWAKGIKALYEAVTNEPLPSSFETLLERLADRPADK